MTNPLEKEYKEMKARARENHRRLEHMRKFGLNEKIYKEVDRSSLESIKFQDIEENIWV